MWTNTTIEMVQYTAAVISVVVLVALIMQGISALMNNAVRGRRYKKNE